VRFGDRLLSRAAERVMLTAERIVSNSEIRKDPFATSIGYADAVVEAPYGSHPYASHGFYVEDDLAIRDYVDASIAYRKHDTKTWEAYLDNWVSGVPSHKDYLSKIPGARLAQLMNAAYAD